MATRKMLVNNQFNSPINLYSPENVSETLQKQAHVLTNGAVGIDFHTLAKPTNLANSAVLKMLQEENSHNRKGLKQVTWPPPPIETYYYPNQTTENNEPPSQQTIGISSPADLSNFTTVPLATTDNRKPNNYEQPPSTIQLRPSLPVRQAPSPVYTSQPATASAQGGTRMRGDMKWPPEPYKQQAAAENAAREAVAKGPVCRPRRVQKDYSSFFAQHALNSTYPGYRAPPGTQHQHQQIDETNF